MVLMQLLVAILISTASKAYLLLSLLSSSVSPKAATFCPATYRDTESVRVCVCVCVST